MARGRMISKSLSTSERRAALHKLVPALAEFCQQLYPLLVAHADDFGRLSGDAFTVKHAIDPTSPRPLRDFERALLALHEVGLLICYEAAGHQLLEIANFEFHQLGLHKRTKSQYPGPIPGNSGKVPEIPGQEKRTELKRREQKYVPKGKSVLLGAVNGSKPSIVDSPAFLEFPTIGPGGTTYRLTESQVAEWQRLFPTLDVKQGARAALAWIVANPHKRKTLRGMDRFLVGWLERTANRGGGGTRAAAGSRLPAWAQDRDGE